MMVPRLRIHGELRNPDGMIIGGFNSFIRPNPEMSKISIINQYKKEVLIPSFGAKVGDTWNIGVEYLSPELDLLKDLDDMWSELRRNQTRGRAERAWLPREWG